MATETLLPDSIVTSTGSPAWTNAAGGTAVVTDVDEGVSTHNGTVDYVKVQLPGSSEGNPSQWTMTFSFANPSLTAPYTDFTVRVAHSSELFFFVPTVFIEIYAPSGTLIKRSDAITGVTGTFTIGTLAATALSVSQANANDLQVKVIVENNVAANTYLLTAIEVIAEDGASVGGGPFSDSVNITDSYVVSGTGSTSNQSFSDSVSITDSYVVSGTGTTPPPIDTERPDITCRGRCGAFARTRDNQIAYADGLGSLILWDGQAAAVTDVASAPVVPFILSTRDRVFLYGEASTTTGTVRTTSGINDIEGTVAWPSTVVGRSISIADVTFGSDGRCSTVITAVTGTIATLRDAPNQNFAAANYAVFGGGGAGPKLNWSAVNDATDWTATALDIGPMDGDIPTGLIALGDYVLLGKRSRLYRFDYGSDPSDADDRALTLLFENRGLVAHGAAVVVEGTAYIMDALGFYVTRGGRFTPFEIGTPVRCNLEPGGTHAIDWNKSSCWFGWYEPQTEAVCWAATLVGEDAPRVVFCYYRPQTEGSDEPGRWTIRTYSHYLLAATMAPGHDGVTRAYLAIADPDDTSKIYLVSSDNDYGDMALGAYSGTVVKQTGNKTYDLGRRSVALREGSLLEIDGERHAVASDDKTVVTLGANFSFSYDAVIGKTWRAGFRPETSFKTIILKPEPAWSRVRLDGVYPHFERVNSNARLQLVVYSDGSTAWDTILGGGAADDLGFQNDSRVPEMHPGIEGHAVQCELKLLSPDGLDRLHALSLLIRKWSEPAGGLPAE